MQEDSAKISGAVILPASDPRAADALIACRMPNPAYDVAVALRDRGRRIWPMPDRFVYGSARLPDGSLAVPRRFDFTLASGAVDRTTLPPADVLPLQVSLRDYQAPAVAAFLDSDATDFLLVAPCGSGKTTIGCAVSASLPTPCLILVHTLDLAHQWQDRLREQVGVPATLIGGGKAQDPARFTVATIQTLARWTWEERQALGSQFGLVVCDEIHHAPAETWGQVLLSLPCRYRLGLTATPERQDGLHPLLYWHLGRPAYTIAAAALQDCGAVLRAEYRTVRTGVVPPDGLEFGEVVTFLTEHPGRNDLLHRTLTDLVAAGRQVLLLTDRVDHATGTAARLQAASVAAAAMTSGTPKRERTSRLLDAREGRLRVLCATSLADEGLDVPSLDALVLASPSRIVPRLVQRLGRILRPAPGKRTPIILDLVDASGPLFGMARKRHRALRDAGLLDERT